MVQQYNNHQLTVYNNTNTTNLTIILDTVGSANSYVKIPATICLSISLVLLLFLALTIGFISKLRDGRPQRQMMKFIFLCQTVSVIITIVLFLVVYDVIDETGCMVAAILVHYFILVTIMLCCMDVLGCYFVYIKLLGLDFLGYRWKMLACSLVVPVIPVILLIVIDTSSYSSITYNRCWYHVNVFHYGLGLPIAIVTAISTIIYLVILVPTIKSASQTTQGQRTKRRIIGRVSKVFGSFLLNVLMWILGHFTQSMVNYDVLFYYLMCITSLVYSCLMFRRSLDKLSQAYWRSVIYRNTENDPE